MIEENKEELIKKILSDYKVFVGLPNKVRENLFKELEKSEILDLDEILEILKKYLIKEKIKEEIAIKVTHILHFLFRHTILWGKPIEQDLKAEMNKKEKEIYENVISHVKKFEKKLKEIFVVDNYKWKNTQKLAKFSTSVSLKAAFKEDFKVTTEPYNAGKDFLSLVPTARFNFLLDNGERKDSILFDVDEKIIKQLMNSLKNTLSQIEFLKNICKRTKKTGTKNSG
jgi:hypothetical protein